MTFRWDRFSKSVLREVARSANLRVTFAAQDLAAAYGAIPDERFIQDVWPILRNRWLGGSPDARQSVIEALRAARLGDAKIKLGTKAGQMAYLNSCHQSASLRAAVLSVFVAVGSVETQDLPEPPPAPEDKDTNVELIEKVFATLDNESCARMEFVILQGLVDAFNKYGVPSADADVAASYLTNNVETAIVSSPLDETPLNPPKSQGRERLIAGARRLAAEHRVNQLRSQIWEFARLGFRDETHDAESLLMVVYPVVLAMIASSDLRRDTEVHGMMEEEVAWVYQTVMHTSDGALSAEASSPVSVPDGSQVARDPGSGRRPPDREVGGRGGRLRRLLGVRPRNDDNHDSSSKGSAPAVIAPDTPQAVSAGDVNARLTMHLTQLLDRKPEVDGDGDVPIVVGSAVVFLRVHADGQSLPFLQAFSFLVQDLQPSPALYECMLEAQTQMRVGKLSFDDGTVMLNVTIPADDLTIHEVDFVLSEATGAADAFDTLLAQKFGGTTAGADVGDVIEA